MVQSLDRIVHGDLDKGRVEHARRAWAVGRNGGLRDRIPVGHGIGEDRASGNKESECCEGRKPSKTLHGCLLFLVLAGPLLLGVDL
jgi:hypothetical protein